MLAMSYHLCCLWRFVIALRPHELETILSSPILTTLYIHDCLRFQYDVVFVFTGPLALRGYSCIQHNLMLHVNAGLTIVFHCNHSLTWVIHCRQRRQEGSRLSSTVRGLDQAFAASERVEEWLQRAAQHGEDGNSSSEENLLRREGPWGYVHMRTLPAAVYVPLQVLGYNRAEWGGLANFVGEP